MPDFETAEAMMAWQEQHEADFVMAAELEGFSLLTKTRPARRVAFVRDGRAAAFALRRLMPFSRRDPTPNYAEAGKVTHVETIGMIRLIGHRDIPEGEVHFVQDGRCVTKIINLNEGAE